MSMEITYCSQFLTKIQSQVNITFPVDFEIVSHLEDFLFQY